MFQSVMTLCRALAQYLLLLSKLPAGLRVPPDKEDDILKFIVMSVEVRNWSIIKDVRKCWESEQLQLSKFGWAVFLPAEISSVVILFDLCW